VIWGGKFQNWHFLCFLIKNVPILNKNLQKRALFIPKLTTPKYQAKNEGQKVKGKNKKNLKKYRCRMLVVC